MDQLLAIARANPSTAAPPHHSQTALPLVPSVPLFAPPLGGGVQVQGRVEGVQGQQGQQPLVSRTLLSALAPRTVAVGLRGAFGDAERRRLLALEPTGVPVLGAEYAALGLGRKKRFGLTDLRALIETPHLERDAWIAVAVAATTIVGKGAVDRRDAAVAALAPLLAFVGRRLNAEVELSFTGSKTLKFADVDKKRPGQIEVAVAPDGVLNIKFTLVN